MFLKLATLALIPALVIQGYHVKKNTLRLPEAFGDRAGSIGAGHPLSILILGDSAAAGVGVQSQSDALSGALLNILGKHYKIDWELLAKTGNKTTDLLKILEHSTENHFDIVITSIGVNDVTQLISPKKWLKLQNHLYRLISNKYSPQLIVATGVPPMNEFPALPNPLAWLFGLYAKDMNLGLKKIMMQHDKIKIVEYDLDEYRNLNLSMAEDGFHPSKEIYQLWAEKIAVIIQQKFN